MHKPYDIFVHYPGTYYNVAYSEDILIFSIIFQHPDGKCCHNNSSETTVYLM